MAASALTKGWRVHRAGGAFKALLRLEEFPLAAAPGTVRVKMQAFPITQLDLDRVRGLCGPTPLPAVGGGAGVGVVAQAAGGFKEGDRVAVLAPGTWATEVAVAPEALLPLPGPLALPTAASLAAGPLSALRLLNHLGLKAGDTVAVAGGDTLPLGHWVAQLAKAWGVIVVPAAGAGKVAPPFGIGLVGGAAAAQLVGAVGPGARLVFCLPPSAEAPVLDAAQLAGKELKVTFLSPVPTAAEVRDGLAKVLGVLGSAPPPSNTRHALPDLLAAVDAVAAGAPDGAHWVALP